MSLGVAAIVTLCEKVVVQSLGLAVQKFPELLILLTALGNEFQI